MSIYFKNTLESNSKDNKAYATLTDRKLRWGGLLENPYISNFQRNCFDYGRVAGLKKALQLYEYESLLDVGCGLGEGIKMNKGKYIGLDNSFGRLKYASMHHPYCFVNGNALHLPFKEASFDLAMLIQTSHHLLDDQFLCALEELTRVTRKYVVIEDPVITDGQNSVSHFIYSLDRGACFRTIEQTKKLLSQMSALKLLNIVSFTTFPGLYIHSAFILQKVK